MPNVPSNTTSLTWFDSVAFSPRPINFNSPSKKFAMAYMLTTAIVYNVLSNDAGRYFRSSTVPFENVRVPLDCRITMIRLVPGSTRDHIKSLQFTKDVRIIAAFKKYRSLKNILCCSRFTNFWDTARQCQTLCLAGSYITLTSIHRTGSGPGPCSDASAYSIFVPDCHKSSQVTFRFLSACFELRTFYDYTNCCNDLLQSAVTLHQLRRRLFMMKAEVAVS